MKFKYKALSAAAVFLHATILSATVTVTVTSPTGSSSTSPVHFVATATSTAGSITGWVVYSDSNNMWQINSTSLNAWVILPFGSHTIIVRAWDSTGAYGSDQFSLTASGAVIPTPPSGAAKETDVEDDTSTPTYYSGWGDCWQPSCSGTTNSNTPTQEFLQGVANPNPQAPATKDAAEFYISGEGGDNGLWWYKMGHSLNTYRNYLWDSWFYLPSSSQNIQATEFDFFQYYAGTDSSGDPQLQRLMWGSQCNYSDIVSGKPVWDSWNDVTGHWIRAVPNNNNGTDGSPTGTPLNCGPWTTNEWHHLQYFVQREFNGSLEYGNVTVDGVTTQWNIQAPLNPSTACSLSDPNCPVTGLQYQLDISGADNQAGTLTEYAELIDVTAW
jgi:hypothetical protein